MKLVWRRGELPHDLIWIGPQTTFAEKDSLPEAQLAMTVGPRGPAGPVGPGANVFDYIQVSPSPSWTVNHNFGRRPIAVSVLSPGGVEVEADVVHVSENQLVVNFAIPYAGSVHVM